MGGRAADATTSEHVHEQYVLDISVVRLRTDGETRYRFEAPDHVGTSFTDPEMATLYADVYFAVNGFVEAGTGDRGIPPEVMQAGKHAMAAYLVTQTSMFWVASFYGAEPTRIERYIEQVREQAVEIRSRAE
jgi:hypothetical protein